MFAWLGNAIAAPILFGLCIILAISTASLEFRIHGLNLFGWQAVNGYQSELAYASKLADQVSNQCTEATNKLVLEGKQAHDAMTAKVAAANLALTQTEGQLNETEAQLKKLLADPAPKPGDERSLGPVVLGYIDGVRRSQSTATSYDAASP